MLFYENEHASVLKPQVLLIRHLKDPERRLAHFQEDIENFILKLLAKKFKTQVVEGDIDLMREVDNINPDLIILESNGGARKRGLKVTNPHYSPQIPRLGWQLQDPHDTSRPYFLGLLNELGIEDVFCYGSSPARQSPDLESMYMFHPLLVDANIFYERNLKRSIPISVFGGTHAPMFYKWRAKLLNELIGHIPTLVYSHPGYFDPAPKERYPVHGTRYAELLSASHFSVADGTLLEYLVWKHLEIPASGSVLITPDFPELKSYGFLDMVNCVCGEPKDVVEKIRFLATNDFEYEKIRQSGYKLVHGSYTFDTNTVLIKWFEKRSKKKEQEKVVQIGEFSDFDCLPVQGIHDEPRRIIESRLSVSSRFVEVMKDCLHVIETNRGLDNAQKRLEELASWLPHLQEPRFLIAVIEMMNGRAVIAINSIINMIRFRVEREGHTQIDPEEALWLLVGLQLKDSNLTRQLIEKLTSFRSETPQRRRLEVLAKKLSDLSMINETLGSQNSKLVFTLEKSGLQLSPLSIHWTSRLTDESFYLIIDQVIKTNT